MSIVPIEINCKDLRQERQKLNNAFTYELLLTENDKSKLKKKVNFESLNRYLEWSNISYEQLHNKCKNDTLYAKAIAMQIAINSCRQGSKDESTILELCNKTTSQLGVNIFSLNNKALRPTKNGNIVSDKEFKEQKLKKNCCLKSFDGKISGKVNGYIFAKITFTDGGHQDNVFEEAHTFAEWCKEYGRNHGDNLYVLLIDTDLTCKFKELKEKYHCDNIWVVNHVEFQKLIIDRYQD